MVVKYKYWIAFVLLLLFGFWISSPSFTEDEDKENAKILCKEAVEIVLGYPNNIQFDGIHRIQVEKDFINIIGYYNQGTEKTHIYGCSYDRNTVNVDVRLE